MIKCAKQNNVNHLVTKGTSVGACGKAEVALLELHFKSKPNFYHKLYLDKSNLKSLTFVRDLHHY